jgi:glucose-6-phosphate-specific signal transduction histidine kinase
LKPGAKQAKAEINKLNETLEEKVILRTNDLAAANQELRNEIIERNRMEEELRNSREQLRNLAAYLQSVREEERSRIARELHDENRSVADGDQTHSGKDHAGAQRRARPGTGTGITNELLGRVRDLSLELRPPCSTTSACCRP